MRDVVWRGLSSIIGIEIVYRRGEMMALDFRGPVWKLQKVEYCYRLEKIEQNPDIGISMDADILTA